MDIKLLTSDDIVKLILKEKNPLKRSLQEELYGRYSEPVYKKCFYLTKNKEDAQDLTHDIFIKVFLNLISYKGVSQFSGWVNAISYNTCMKYLKNRNKFVFEDLNNEKEEIITDSKHSKWATLEDSLKEMKPEIRLLLSMKYFDNLSIKDIATHLEISESAVKMRLNRGRNHLKSLVEKENESV